MANHYMANCRRIQTVLLDNGYTTRTRILTHLDAHGKGAVGLLGIGPKLSKQLALILRDAGEIEWAAAFPEIAWQ